MRMLTPDPFAGIKMPPRLKPLTPVDKARMSGVRAIVRLMASTMIEMRALKGDCTEQDLRMTGFRKAEIEAHAMTARQDALRTVREAA